MRTAAGQMRTPSAIDMLVPGIGTIVSTFIPSSYPLAKSPGDSRHSASRIVKRIPATLFQPQRLQSDDGIGNARQECQDETREQEQPARWLQNDVRGPEQRRHCPEQNHQRAESISHSGWNDAQS